MKLSEDAVLKLMCDKLPPSTLVHLVRESGPLEVVEVKRHVMDFLQSLVDAQTRCPSCESALRDGEYGR